MKLRYELPAPSVSGIPDSIQSCFSSDLFVNDTKSFPVCISRSNFFNGLYVKKYSSTVDALLFHCRPPAVSRRIGFLASEIVVNSVNAHTFFWFSHILKEIGRVAKPPIANRYASASISRIALIFRTKTARNHSLVGLIPSFLTSSMGSSGIASYFFMKASARFGDFASQVSSLCCFGSSAVTPAMPHVFTALHSPGISNNGKPSENIPRQVLKSRIRRKLLAHVKICNHSLACLKLLALYSSTNKAISS